MDGTGDLFDRFVAALSGKFEMAVDSISARQIPVLRRADKPGAIRSTHF